MKAIQLPAAARKGAAMVTALCMIILIATLALTYLSAGVDSARQIDHHGDAFGIKSGAESAIALGVNGLWSGYVSSKGGTPGQLNDFRAYLDGIGVTPDAETGQPDASTGKDITALADLPSSPTGQGALGGSVVDSVRVVRRDTGDNTQLFVTASVRPRRGEGVNQKGNRESIQQAFSVERGEWTGLDYALLANNVNCILCHATIDDAARVFNKDPSKFGTFDRVKVGALESLMLRGSSTTTIAGTLYTRGAAMMKDGSLITDWSSMKIQGMEFDEHGKIVEDSFGSPNIVDLVPAGNPPQPMENLYVDYAKTNAAQVDGYLPDSFPPVFPDDGGIDPVTGAPITTGAGNRKVDAGEFAAAAEKASGSLSGGTIYVGNASSQIDTAAKLTSALSTGNTTSLSSKTTGPTILIGTAANPIVINGQIAIDGDLVIQGYVKGEGSLVVSGNVYLPTDVRYVDGSNASGRTFGIAPDGTKNSLAIAAGGSMIAGDLYDGMTPAKLTGTESGQFTFVLSEVSIFNRGEWSKTQPKLPGKGEDIDNPATWTEPNPGYMGPSYVPRYYSLTEGGTVPIFNKAGLYYDATTESWHGKEHVGSWSASAHMLAHPNDPTDPILYNPNGTPKAAVHALTGTGGWMSNAMLASMMQKAVAAHPRNQPLRIDAMLYSSNSIYGLVPKSSPMGGRMEVNGAIVASDVGLLVSNGLNLNYDRRPKDLLKIESSEGSVTIVRRLWLGAVPAHY